MTRGEADRIPRGRKGASAAAAAPGKGRGARKGARAAGPKRKQEPKPGPHDALKEEAARELGLWERVQSAGWGELSAAETGRVGAYITRVLRLRQQAAGAGPAGRG